MNILLIAKNEYKDLLKEYKITKCDDYTKIKEYMHQEFDAIIIDSNIDYNVLSILYEYDNPFNLSKTIILDNNYACYSMLNEDYQLYAILNKSHIKYIDYYLEKIKERNVLYNYNKANLYDEIAQMLKRLGISPDKDGFHYLRKAIYEIFYYWLNNSNVVNIDVNVCHSNCHNNSVRIRKIKNVRHGGTMFIEGDITGGVNL